MSGNPAAALLALAAALAVWPGRRAPVRARMSALREALGEARPPRRAEDPAAVRRRSRGLAVAAGLGGGLLVGGLAGLVVGAGVAVVVERLLGRAGGDASDDGRAVVEDLPIACDLLAVCLEAGLPPGGALAAVGSAVRPPLAAHLTHVAGLYRLGAEPRRAWAEAPPELAVLGRVLARAGESGSAVRPALHGVAAEVRASARAATESAVRRAGVWVLAPLGLCFLPAFVCLGVAPLVLGIARDVFG